MALRANMRQSRKKDLSTLLEQICETVALSPPLSLPAAPVFYFPPRLFLPPSHFSPPGCALNLTCSGFHENSCLLSDPAGKCVTEQGELRWRAASGPSCDCSGLYTRDAWRINGMKIRHVQMQNIWIIPAANLCWETQIMNLLAIIVDVVIVGDGPITRPLGPDNGLFAWWKFWKLDLSLKNKSAFFAAWDLHSL